MTRLRFLLAVGSVSAVGLAYEVLLTNLYAVTMQYHFVFLAISVAMFGAGVGALAIHKFRFRLAARLDSLSWGLAAVLAVLLVGMVPALFSLAQMGQTTAEILVSALPFVLVGAFLALALQQNAAHGPQVYGADLLGAALGAGLVPLALNWCGGPAAALLVALAAALAAVLLAPRRFWPWLAALITALAIGLQGSTGWLATPLNLGRLQAAPPDKTLVHVLQTEPTARITDTDWDAFARVDVVATGDPDRRMLFLDGGAGSYMYRWDGQLDSVAKLKESTEFLPFALGPADRTLVIGPGGGRDVLLALLAGADQVDAVELSPGVVRQVKKAAAYNGLAGRPDVTWTVADGRNFLHPAVQPYDLIVLDLVYTQVAGAHTYALAENYIFTQEAFQEYYRHLKPGGRIAVIAHQALEGSRAFLTGYAAWQQQGAQLAPQEGALLMAQSDDPTQRTTVAVWQKGTLTADQQQVLQVGAKALGLQPLYLPGVYDLPFQPLMSGKQSLAAFTATGDYNLAPTADNRPFFFNLDWGLPPTLVDVTLLVLLLALGFGIWIAAPERRGKAATVARPTGTGRLYGYALLLGVAYMLCQVPLIQRFLLLLGSPVATTATVLVALLLGSGVASLVAQRFERLRTRWAPAAVAVAVLLYTFVLPALIPALAGLARVEQLALAVVLCLPLGFLLGLPFPAALWWAARAGLSPAPIYAANSVASIIGSVLAMVLSVSTGFTATAGIAAAAYGLAAWVLPDIPAQTPVRDSAPERKRLRA